MSLCQCGCGEATEIAAKTRSDRGWVKGQPKPFVGKHRLRFAGLAERLDEAVERRTDGCWVWTRATAGGYGYVRVQGRLEPAHRVFYERANGSVPEGWHLDHLCRNRRCVNPDHLEPVPEAVNIRRGLESRRAGDIERVREMHAAGAPLRRISRELGISRHFVQNVARGKYSQEKP